MVQQLERHGDQLDGDARGLCRQQVERVRALVERELKRARIAGGGSPGTLFDPTVELPVLAELLKRMYRDKGLRLDCHIGTTQPLLMDREDLLELTGTLLDNACKWAFSRVHCAITATNGGIRIRIEDDGPGCDETALADLGERGTRLDEAVDGHGLGLSIAREIVDSYDGRLKLGRSDTLGGFSAIIELPIQQMQNAPLKSLASPVAS
jgi:signal transduction histidine kinase